ARRGGRGRTQEDRQFGRAADGQQAGSALRVHPGAGGVRRRGIAGRVAQAHAAPVFKPALRATLSTKIWRSGATCRRRVVGRRGRACTPCSTLRPRGHPSNPKLTQLRRRFHRGGIFIPALHRSGQARAPVGRSNSLGEAVERALRVRRSKTARVFSKEENEYHLRACWLACGSVSFTASSQAIHRETK